MVIHAPVQQPQHSPEAIEAAKQMLANRNIVDEIRRDIETIGVAGEEDLALALYYVGTSRLLAKPLAAIVQGPSAAGKSYVISRIADMFPPEGVIQAHRITPHALEYVEGGLEHALVVGGERSQTQSPDATRALRELLASGHLTLWGANQFKQVQGPVAFIESTSVDDQKIFGEDLNRCLLLQIDASKQQTEKILAGIAKRKAYAPDHQRVQQTIDKHRAAQSLLKRCEVSIPYAEALATQYEKSFVEARRSFQQVLSLIESIALLQQYQRIQEPEDGKLIIATSADYELARELLAKPRKPTVQGATGKVYTWLQAHGQPAEATVIAGNTRQDPSDVRGYLKKLVNSGLVTITKKKRPTMYEAVALPTADDGKDLPMVDSIGDHGCPHCDLIPVMEYRAPKSSKQPWELVLDADVVRLPDLTMASIEELLKTRSAAAEEGESSGEANAA